MNEKGRSMVEMLGVLAIIGILSAGGLAGYSKAMFQHRANETINTVSLVLQRLIELSQKDLGDDFKIQNADDIVKYGLLENCQKISYNECKLPIGNIYVDGSAYIDIEFYSAKECIAFSSAHWEKVLPIDWVNQGVELLIGGAGDTVIYNNAINKTSLDEITATCHAMCDGLDGSVCYMEIIFGDVFR